MLGQHRSAQRPIPKGRERDAGLAVDIIEPERRHGRLGNRKIAEMLLLEAERLTSRLAVRGRMASLRASTHACEMGF